MLSKPVVIRKCLYFYLCKKEEIYTGRWKEHWHPYKDGYICKKCYSRLITNPKKTKEYIKKYNDRKTKEQRKEDNAKTKPKFITYHKKQIYINFKTRTGYCSWCHNNIYDKSCKLTHMHHKEYYPIFVWFGTIEICVSCHSKITWQEFKQNNNISFIKRKRDGITGKFIKNNNY